MGRAVEFETAKLARDKGYHYSSYQAYSVWRDKIRKNDICPLHGYEIEPEPMGYGSFAEIRRFYNSKQDIVAPDQADLQAWLRNEHKLDLDILRGHYDDFVKVQTYTCLILDKDKRITVRTEDNQLSHLSYEKALEKGLFDALKLIK